MIRIANRSAESKDPYRQSHLVAAAMHSLGALVCTQDDSTSDNFSVFAFFSRSGSGSSDFSTADSLFC